MYVRGFGDEIASCQKSWFDQLVVGISDSLKHSSGYGIDPDLLPKIVTNAIMFSETFDPEGSVFQGFKKALRTSPEAAIEYVTNRLESLGAVNSVTTFLGGWVVGQGTWEAWKVLVSNLDACSNSPDKVAPPVPAGGNVVPSPEPEPPAVSKAGFPWIWLLVVAGGAYIVGRNY